jgi:hypothetical protein
MVHLGWREAKPPLGLGLCVAAHPFGALDVRGVHSTYPVAQCADYSNKSAERLYRNALVVTYF